MNTFIKEKYLLLLLVIIFLMSSVINNPLYAQRRSKSVGSKFQPGDAVRIEIIEIMEVQSGASNIDVNDDYTIAKDGTILMPLIGRLKVTGNTEETLIELLKQKYSPYYKEPFITVVSLIRVTLMGAFNKPGSYRIDPEESLWELINLAGGPRSDCDLNTLQIERGGEVVVKDLLNSFEQGYSIDEIGIRSGDQVIAHAESHIKFRDVLDYTRFGISLVMLYLQIQNLSN